MFKSNKHKNSDNHPSSRESSREIDWENRATPQMFILSAGAGYVRQLKKQNRDMLAQKLVDMRTQASTAEGAPAPQMIGYWAVPKEVADEMSDKGIPEYKREQAEKFHDTNPGYKGQVTAWDSLAAGQALVRVGGLLVGNDLRGDVRVIKVGMIDPEADRSGNLMWHADPDNTELLEVYTPEEFTGVLREMKAFAGRQALQGAFED